MITVIISDLHLTEEFDKRKFDYLESVFNGADRVIINGDFWDRYFVEFDEFVKSEWRKLFPLLKAKKAIYLFGNHDRKNWCDERVKLFSAVASGKVNLSINGKRFHVQHGNRVVPAPDDRFSWLNEKKLGRTLVALCIRLFVRRLLSTSTGEWYLKRINKKMKKWWESQSLEKEILVCGHSHWAEFNLNARYLNSGFVNYGYGQYLKISKDKLELVEERY